MLVRLNWYILWFFLQNYIFLSKFLSKFFIILLYILGDKDNQQLVGQISQVKHQLDSRLEIGSGYEMAVNEYSTGNKRVLLLIGDYSSKKAMIYYRIVHAFDENVMIPHRIPNLITPCVIFGVEYHTSHYTRYTIYNISV